jgi:hypothetical protein
MLKYNISVRVFKDENKCCSIMDTVGHRVPTKQIRDLSNFNVSNVKVCHSCKQHLKISRRF